MDLVERWKALEEAYHEILPNQGDPGDEAMAKGKELCQFLYDNSETIRDTLEAQQSEIKRKDAALVEAREAILAAAQGTLWCSDAHPAETVVDHIDAALKSVGTATGRAR